MSSPAPSGQMASEPMSGPPYLPPNALLGGQPTNDVDTPIAAVFLVLFIIGAACHMSILQLNRRKSHKFILSGLLFGFCMARITTMIMRIVWANRLENVSVAIAAQVFSNAGVVLLFLVNLIFTQRVLRASHPNVFWSRPVHFAFLFLYGLLLVSLFMLIGLTVTSFYTTDMYLRTVARDIQWYGQSVFLFIAVLPFPLLLGNWLVPRKQRVDKFGTGRHRSKIIILLCTTFLLSLGAAFRTGTNFLPPRPRSDPAWYQSKACYWTFYFVIEIVVVYLYVIVRVDRRFHVPNGSKGYGDYSRGKSAKDVIGADESPASRVETRIMSEEEMFDEPEEGPKDEEEAVAKERR